LHGGEIDGFAWTQIAIEAAQQKFFRDEGLELPDEVFAYRLT
jgi:hypothetical protein